MSRFHLSIIFLYLVIFSFHRTLQKMLQRSWNFYCSLEIYSAGSSKKIIWKIQKLAIRAFFLFLVIWKCVFLWLSSISETSRFLLKLLSTARKLAEFNSFYTQPSTQYTSAPVFYENRIMLIMVLHRFCFLQNCFLP